MHNKTAKLVGGSHPSAQRYCEDAEPETRCLEGILTMYSAMA